MAINIQGNPLAEVLTQGMRSIPSAMSSGYQRNLSERQHQLAQDQFDEQKNLNQLQMAQSLLQLQTYRDENLMDAAGYKNPAVGHFFTNLKYQGGQLKSNPGVPGGWQWTGQTALPSRDIALEDYKNRVTAGGKLWKKNDLTLFNRQYDDAVASRANRVVRELQKLKMTGLNPDEINYILSQPENAHLADAISTLYSDETTTQDQMNVLKNYLPKKQLTPSQIMTNLGSAGATTVMAGMGAAQALDYFGSKGLLEEAEKKFGPKRDKFKSQLDKAKKDLTKAQKSKAKNAPSKVKTLTNKVKKLTSKYNKQATHTKRNIAKYVRKNAMSSRALRSLRGPMPSALAATVSSEILGGLGERVAGTKGRAYGQLAGAGLKGGLGAAALGRFGKGVFNVGKNLLWRAPVALGGAMGDSPLPGPMDAAMAAWLLSGAKSDWDKSMRSFDRAAAGR